MASPSVYAYLVSHYAVILTKAATQQRPPSLDLCLLGLDMKSGILVLVIALASARPGALINAIACGCVAQEKPCSIQYSFMVNIFHV